MSLHQHKAAQIAIQAVFFAYVAAVTWDGSYFAPGGVPLNDLIFPLVAAAAVAIPRATLHVGELFFLLGVAALNWLCILIASYRFPEIDFNMFGIPTIKVLVGIAGLLSITLLTREFPKLLATARAAIALSGWIAIGHFLLEAQDGEIPERWTGSFADPNYLAVYLCIPLSVAFATLWYATRSRPRVLAAVQSLLLIPVILSTGSRAGVLSLAVLIFIYLVVLMRSRARKRVQAVMWIAVPAAVSVALGFSILSELGIAEFWMRRFDVDRIVSSGGAGRVAIWKEALRIWSENWWGLGLGNAKYIVGESFGRLRAMHNVFLQSLVELGLIGFILVTFFIGWAVFRIVRYGWLAAGSRTGILGFGPAALVVILGGLTLDMLNVRYFWIILALAVNEARRGRGSRRRG